VRVVDTSAWIEWLMDSPTGRKVARQFPARDECIVPTIVQLEISKWAMRELDEPRADQIIANTRQCMVVPLDTAIALRAAELNRVHKLATADAIVYATSLEYNADLLTCDAHFTGLPQCILVRKTR
jgi:predicted nucleic acid-binding protein